MTTKTPDASSNHTANEQSFPPPITTEMLQFRLDTGNMLKSGGQRASLTRCAEKYGTYQTTLQATDPNPEAIETAKDDLQRELQLFELEMIKLILWEKGLERQIQKNQERILQREQDIATLQKTVTESSADAHHYLQTQTCLSEYETLAKLINDNHATSQEELQSKINSIQTERTTVDRQIIETEQTLRVREAQFQLLMQYMLDLKRSLKEDEEDKAEGKQGNLMTAMEVDESLYGDL
ncbi:hypothetical protein IV203_001812 [Nitzschia inconspicua]|uniref:Uncharacterized protein n=1 Tax=Nitzschia inconspicua TaxID=303405 RepID=A0A9K3L769_9STRA|nr:hypothetical protein IV203_001812 [Nitzschia inconspicua]